MSSRRIESEIDRGARTAAQIGASCGAGTGCGGCIPLIEALIDEHMLVRDQARELLREVAVELALPHPVSVELVDSDSAAA